MPIEEAAFSKSFPDGGFPPGHAANSAAMVETRVLSETLAATDVLSFNDCSSARNASVRTTNNESSGKLTEAV